MQDGAAGEPLQAMRERDGLWGAPSIAASIWFLPMYPCGH